MTIVKNYFSKIYHNDSSEAFSIIVCIDFDSALDPELVKSDMNEIVEKNPILKQSITEENGCLLFNTCNNFKIEEHYTIKYIKSKKFNDYICKLSNEKFNMEVKWKFLLCIDKKSKKSKNNSKKNKHKSKKIKSKNYLL